MLTSSSPSAHFELPFLPPNSQSRVPTPLAACGPSVGRILPAVGPWRLFSHRRAAEAQPAQGNASGRPESVEAWSRSAETCPAATGVSGRDPLQPWGEPAFREQSPAQPGGRGLRVLTCGRPPRRGNAARHPGRTSPPRAPEPRPWTLRTARPAALPSGPWRDTHSEADMPHQEFTPHSEARTGADWRPSVPPQSG